MGEGHEDDMNFGLELVLNCHREEFENKGDPILVLIHWHLLRLANLRNVGIGEVFSINSDTNPSEMLPKEIWKHKEEKSLKYRGIGDKKTDKYILKANDLLGESTLFILYRVSDEKSSEISLDHKNEVKSKDASTYSEIFGDFEGIMEKIRKDLVEPIFPNSQKTIEDKKTNNDSKSQSEDSHQSDPLRIGQPRYPGHYPHPHGPVFPDPFGPLGGADLDPRGGMMGGGMVMDPHRGGRGGRGAFPGGRGGVRFDPPGPMFPGGGRGNYGDEMPPPGFHNGFGGPGMGPGGMFM